MFIFVSGTSRSGKSRWAEQRLVQLAGDVMSKIYIATAEASDFEMRLRIEKHKIAREGKNFITIERSHDLGGILNKIPKNSAVLLESLSSLAANEMFAQNGPVVKAEDAAKKIYRDVISIKKASQHLIVVSDDIFTDGIIYDELTESYLKMLCRLHVKFAYKSDEAVEISTGICFKHAVK